MSSREQGQATVEFALVVPLVVLALSAVLQMSLVAYSQLAVTHVAREVARAIAVDPNADVDQLVNSLYPSETMDLVVEVHLESAPIAGRELVVVSVSFKVMPIIGIFQPFSDYFDVHAQAAMLRE